MNMNQTAQTPTSHGASSLPSGEGNQSNPMPRVTEASEASPQPKPKSRRGFAAMDPKLVSEIASKGGRAAHAAGTAHEFSRDEAREAGRKGGLAPHTRRKSSRPAGEPPPASPPPSSPPT